MDFFGLDIGTVNTKVVRLSKSRGAFRLEAAAMSPTPVGGMLVDNDASVHQMAEAVMKIRNDARISTKNVVASLPESEVFTRIVSLPKMTMNELETAISWEAEQYIPLPLSEVNYSYTVVEMRPDGGIEVLIVAAPIRLVEKYENVLKMAGLNPVAIETELIATSRCVVSGAEQSVTMVIDLGAKSTDMSIVKGGNVVFTRSIGTAGGAFTRALMTNLQLDENQAESFKRSYGFAANQLEGRVAAAMDQVLTVITAEVQRTVNFFASRGGAQVSNIRLVGGSSLIPDLVPKMAQSFNIEIQVGNVMAMVDDAGRGAQIEGLPMYAVAIGLAMKDL